MSESERAAPRKWSGGYPARVVSLLVLTVMFVGRSAGAQASSGRPLALDLYEKGIRSATLRNGTAPSFTFTVRRRNWTTGQWGAPETVPLDSLAHGSKQLPGSLAAWARLLPRIVAANWASAQGRVVLAPDSARSFTYVRHRSIAGATDRDASDQEQWALEDGGLMHYGFSPLDLIIDPGNTFVAAIDPSDDNVLVAPGAEGRTTVRLWQRPHVSGAQFGVTALPRAMVPMSDGVHSATYILSARRRGGDGSISGGAHTHTVQCGTGD